MTKHWFYRQADRLHGPLTIQDVRAALLLRFLKPDDLVREGLRGDWKPAWRVRELRALAPPPDDDDDSGAFDR